MGKSNSIPIMIYRPAAMIWIKQPKHSFERQPNNDLYCPELTSRLPVICQDFGHLVLLRDGLSLLVADGCWKRTSSSLAVC